MATEQETISDLLALARDGDKEALDRLFARCRSYLAIAAQANVDSWAQPKFDSSDVVQQTLLEAYRGFERFEGATPGELLCWLRQILNNNSADLVRQYKMTEKRRVGREVPMHRPATGSASEAKLDPPAAGETPSQYLAREEQQLELAEALAQLSDDHRQVIVLRNFQRLSFNEIAEIMERTRPAVQMLWARAVHKLQETMANENGNS